MKKKIIVLLSLIKWYHKFDLNVILLSLIKLYHKFDLNVILLSLIKLYHKFDLNVTKFFSFFFKKKEKEK